jgi:hypothetical protein
VVAGSDKGAVVHDKASFGVPICGLGEICAVHNILRVFSQVILHKNLSDIKVDAIEVEVGVHKEEFGGLLLSGG